MIVVESVEVLNEVICWFIKYSVSINEAWTHNKDMIQHRHTNGKLSKSRIDWHDDITIHVYMYVFIYNTHQIS